MVISILTQPKKKKQELLIVIKVVRLKNVFPQRRHFSAGQSDALKIKALKETPCRAFGIDHTAEFVSSGGKRQID